MTGFAGYGPARLVQLAARAADLAHGRHITEGHAVEILVDAALRDTTRLRDATVLAQEDPDAVPLVAALLDRAATAAQRPLPVRVFKPHLGPGPQPSGLA